MTTGSDDEWGRPIDLMVDSDAPDQIALELGRRHALYLREAQRIVLEGAVPDEGGLTAGIKAETTRYLALPAVARGRRARSGRGRRRGEHARHTAGDRRDGRRSVPPTPAPPPARPIRRLALQPSATIVGNMAVRKQPTERGLELAWDAAPQVIEWVLRVSVRPDPRQDYVEGEAETLPATHPLVRGRARRPPSPDPALRPRPRRQDRAPRRHLGADERQQRRPVEAAGDRELIAGVLSPLTWLTLLAILG